MVGINQGEKMKIITIFVLSLCFSSIGMFRVTYGDTTKILEYHKNGSLKKYIIEVKPKNQCTPPERNPKRRTGVWYNKVKTWGINKAKWKSATEFCLDHDMEFKILTEDHLNPR